MIQIIGKLLLYLFLSLELEEKLDNFWQKIGSKRKIEAAESSEEESNQVDSRSETCQFRHTRAD